MYKRQLQATAVITRGTPVAILAVVLAVVLLYRRITDIAWFSRLLAVGVFGSLAWIIFTGLTHFNRQMAFDLPANAFHLTPEFFTGLGAAMLDVYKRQVELNSRQGTTPSTLAFIVR